MTPARSYQDRVHRLDNARYHGGPRTSPVLAIIAHCTAGQSALSSIRYLNTPREQFEPGQVPASYHYVIDHDGEIYRHCDPTLVAYHAGASHWPGLPAVRNSLNHCTVGVAWANLNRAATDRLTVAQLDAGLWLFRVLMAKHAVPPARVLGHREVSPGRKFDPLPSILDMTLWRNELATAIR